APILALYFTSAWCDDSQVSHEPVLEVTKKQQNLVAAEKSDDDKDYCHQHDVDLVYVSSDTSTQELEGNLEDGWNFLPFEQEELRSNIKRHFGICAKKEMETLGITSDDRKGGIPTLILIDTKTGKVLHSDAIPHVMGDTKVECPLTHWKSLVEAAESSTDTNNGSKTGRADENDKSTHEENDAKKQKVEEK
ncbi:MAG: hypothetical protein SGARI_004836, partial [Bacillariaceae sp.]